MTSLSSDIQYLMSWQLNLWTLACPANISSLPTSVTHPKPRKYDQIVLFCGVSLKKSPDLVGASFGFNYNSVTAYFNSW